MRLACCALALGACSVRYQSAEFPDDGDKWQVPLYRPLTSSNPFLWVDLEGNEGGRAQSRMLVDTGAFSNLVPRTMFPVLGLTAREDRQLRLVDARGTYKNWRGAMLPAIRAGSLVLEDVPVGIGANVPIAGYDILSQHPMYIDQDRGVIEFGAEEKKDAIAEVELQWRRHSSLASLHLHGQDVLLHFDTGASMSTLDPETADDLGLEIKKLDEPFNVLAVHGEEEITEKYVAKDVKFGSAELGELHLYPGRGQGGDLVADAVHGLLGMDVLRRFNMWVDLGERVQLLKRRSLLHTAPQRMRRWSWAPRCEGVPGCVSVEIGTDTDDGVVVRAQLHADFETPTAFLVGCVGEGEELDPAMPALEILIYAMKAGRFSMKVSKKSPRKLSRIWAKHVGQRCVRLSPIDINPAYEQYEERPARKPFIRTTYPPR